MLMGIQLILPALPIMQRDLGLSDSEIALVTSLYLLPSIFFAFLGGLLADKLGRRRVFAISMGIFGIAGLALSVANTFQIVLAIRLVQGAAYAAIAPLAITLIGDLLSGVEQVAAQGRRIVAMAIGDTALPLIGGVLVTISWHTPFILQGATIVMAVLAWYWLPRGTKTEYTLPTHMKELLNALKSPVGLSLESAGFLRMFFKFGYMTYLPILLVTNRGMSATVAGIALAAAALFGVVVAAFAGTLVAWIPPSRLMGLSLLLIGGAMLATAAFSTSPLPAILASLVFGAGDGAFGVMQNSIVTNVQSASLRATFVSAIGSVRNLGKFLAPLALGLSTLVISLPTSFTILGILAIISILTAWPLERLDDQLTRQDSLPASA